MNKISYSEAVKNAGKLIRSTDKILLGMGSGLSAAGGLNYGDPALAQEWYPEYYEIGFHSIAQIQQLYWFYPQCDPAKYWGFWARHIHHIRYQTEALKPYRDLKALLEGKDYFIITTNVDSQAEKVGFSPDKIFATQGNYCYFQCSKPCRDEIYENKAMVQTMVEHMPTPFTVREEDIPKCPHCGGPLVPNLRCDHTFVETPHMENLPSYMQFLEECEMENVVLLELGVGFNTPVIIRYPFEEITGSYPNARLIRINDAYADVPESIAGKSLSIQADLGKAISDILAEYS